MLLFENNLTFVIVKRGNDSIHVIHHLISEDTALAALPMFSYLAFVKGIVCRYVGPAQISITIHPIYFTFGVLQGTQVSAVLHLVQFAISP